MAKQAKRPSRNQLRIIGGKWRGRKIQFPEVEGLRPSTDRVRETVFNWLSGWLQGSSCLDLFAGSGALGFEAASRGASSVVMIELNREAINGLNSAKALLDADTVSIFQTSAEDFLNQSQPLVSFDLLFLDPPFAYNEISTLLNSIAHRPLLKPNGWVYLESAVNKDIVVPENWRLHRQKQAGQVVYRLFQLNPPDTALNTLNS